MRFIVLGTLAAMLCYYAYTEDDEQDRKERQKQLTIDEFDNQFLFQLENDYQDELQRQITIQNQNQINTAIAIQKIQRLQKKEQIHHNQNIQIKQPKSEVKSQVLIQHQTENKGKDSTKQFQQLKVVQSIQINEIQGKHNKNIQQNMQQKLKMRTKNKIVKNRKEYILENKPIKLENKNKKDIPLNNNSKNGRFHSNRQKNLNQQKKVFGQSRYQQRKGGKLNKKYETIIQ